MRRLPIYFLIDVSEPMAGEPIERANMVLKQLLKKALQDPYALESFYISIVIYEEKVTQVLPLVSLVDCLNDDGEMCIPQLNIATDVKFANVENALTQLNNIAINEVRKSTFEQKGDYPPTLILFANGDCAFSNINDENYNTIRSYYGKIIILVDHKNIIVPSELISDDISHVTDWNHAIKWQWCTNEPMTSNGQILPPPPPFSITI